jgi:hypothetical protein
LELKILLNRFAQVSPKTYTQYHDSGLGLWISRKLRAARRSDWCWYSTVGVGTKFFLTSKPSDMALTILVILQLWILVVPM